MASIRAFKRNFPGKKRDVAETKERAFPDSLVSFSLQARTRLSKSAISQSWREGATEVPPETRSDGVHAREHFACSNSTFSFPFPLPRSSRVRPQRSLLFILRYFRRSCDRLEMRRRLAGNGTEDGEARARRRWKGGEQRIVPTGFTRSLWTGKRGDTSLVARKRGKGVILPCVTRITRAALKSTRRTFYRGQS